MKQMEISKWLRGITITLGIMGIVFFFLIVPILADDMRRFNPEVAFLYWPGLIYSFVIAIGCYAVLFFFWKVSVEIGRDNSFSKENAESFINISRITFSLAIIWFAGMIFLTVNRWMQRALFVYMVFAVFISIIISILAAALSRLIIKAYEMKKENELTI